MGKYWVIFGAKGKGYVLQQTDHNAVMRIAAIHRNPPAPFNIMLGSPIVPIGLYMTDLCEEVLENLIYHKF